MVLSRGSLQRLVEKSTFSPDPCSLLSTHVVPGPSAVSRTGERRCVLFGVRTDVYLKKKILPDLRVKCRPRQFEASQNSALQVLSVSCGPMAI